MLCNFAGRKRGTITLVAGDEVLLFLFLRLVDWSISEVVAAVATKEFRAVRGMEMRLELGSRHFDTEETKAPGQDAR